MISETLLQELQQIVREDYGKNLGKEELTEIANTLVKTFDLLAKVESRNKKSNILDTKKNEIN
ncbi:MAG: hypothetical protein KBH94_04230 [Caldisericia bacterium]|nr:hypothetical protein [Caldisericia bacterium]